MKTKEEFAKPSLYTWGQQLIAMAEFAECVQFDFKNVIIEKCLHLSHIHIHYSVWDILPACLWEWYFFDRMQMSLSIIDFFVGFPQKLSNFSETWLN